MSERVGYIAGHSSLAHELLKAAMFAGYWRKAAKYGYADLCDQEARKYEDQARQFAARIIGAGL